MNSTQTEILKRLEALERQTSRAKNEAGGVFNRLGRIKRNFNSSYAILITALVFFPLGLWAASVSSGLHEFSEGDVVSSSKINENFSLLALKSVPSTMVAFFPGDCPDGWSEYTELRGRFLVGTPHNGTNEGTVGSALTNLQNKTHSHSFDVTGSTEDHALTIAEMPAHDHANGDFQYLLQQNGTNSVFSTDASATEPDVSNKGAIASEGGNQGHNHGLDYSGTTGLSNLGSIAPYIQLTACQAD